MCTGSLLFTLRPDMRSNMIDGYQLEGNVESVRMIIENEAGSESSSLTKIVDLRPELSEAGHDGLTTDDGLEDGAGREAHEETLRVGSDVEAEGWEGPNDGPQAIDVSKVAATPAEVLDRAHYRIPQHDVGELIRVEADLHMHITPDVDHS